MQWPGIATGIQVQENLFDQKSQYQHIQVFKSVSFGNVLILDGVIQLTEKDEKSYQEMITHLPMYSHPNPESVLIIGGGDGGVIREVVKHAGVKQITICEIDQVVIDAGKKYFPSVAAAWDDERVTLVCGDASVYINDPANFGKYDVIICDSSDPVGPAQALFESPFYMAMEKALKPGGKISTQAESLWMHFPLIEKLVREASTIFEEADYASIQIPTYPCGQIGILVCSKAGGKSRRSATVRKAVRVPSKEEQANLRWYTNQMHEGAFYLPAEETRKLKEAQNVGHEAYVKAQGEKNKEYNAEEDTTASGKKKRKSSQ